MKILYKYQELGYSSYLRSFGVGGCMNVDQKTSFGSRDYSIHFNFLFHYICRVRGSGYNFTLFWVWRRNLSYSEGENHWNSKKKRLWNIQDMC